MVMMENDCHNMILVGSMIIVLLNTFEKFPKIRFPPGGYQGKLALIHESLYHFPHLHRCFDILVWVTSMARVALRTLLCVSLKPRL